MVTSEAPTRCRSCSSVSPSHLNAKVARWRSNDPMSVSASEPASGGST